MQVRSLMQIVVAGLVAGVSASQTLPAGCDCYVTPAPPTGTSTVRIPAHPGGFFGSVAGNPSDAFGPLVIPVKGLALPQPTITSMCPNAVKFQTVWVDPHGTPVAPTDKHAVGQSSITIVDPVDTIVCRPSATTLPAVGNSTPVPIELVELSLTSVSPITVSYGGGAATRQWNVFVTENGTGALGGMTIVTTGTLPGSVAGNMTMNQLPVSFQLSFQEVAMVIPAPVPVNGSLNFVNPSTGTWQFTLGPMIPTLPQWGYVILVLALMVAGSLAIRRRALAFAGSTGASVQGAPTQLRLPRLTTTLAIAALIYGGVWLAFGTLVPADVVGGLLAAPMLAFLVQAWFGRNSGR